MLYDIELIILDLEREMQEGILHAEDPHNTCLTFLRTIVDLKNYVTHPMAPNFMEVMHLTLLKSGF